MYRSISTADVTGKTVLVRADLNVPMSQGKITNAERLSRLAPGFRSLLERGAKIVVLSHFGRPKGQVVEAMSLAPVAQALSKILECPLSFVSDWRGAIASRAAAQLQPGEALVLENLRFDLGEETNDRGLAKDLAAMGDLYVNDAFSVAHRAHASTDALAKLLPAYAGDLMVAELEALEAVLTTPERPLMAIVGGAKVSSKFDLLFNLITKVDLLVIGGGMANTFLMAKGIEVGASLCEPDLADRSLEVLACARARGCNILLPHDAVCAKNLDTGDQTQTFDMTHLPKDQMILDFGPASVTDILNVLPSVKTLIWNGPVGAFEFPPFDTATKVIAQAVADQTKTGHLRSVAGGGDTVAALDQAGVLADFTYVSTAGGAFLEWMEGRTLPGVAALAGSA